MTQQLELLLETAPEECETYNTPKLHDLKPYLTGIEYAGRAFSDVAQMGQRIGPHAQKVHPDDTKTQMKLLENELRYDNLKGLKTPAGNKAYFNNINDTLNKGNTNTYQHKQNIKSINNAFWRHINKEHFQKVLKQNQRSTLDLLAGETPSTKPTKTPHGVKEIDWSTTLAILWNNYSQDPSIAGTSDVNRVQRIKNNFQEVYNEAQSIKYGS